jgi:hypothetical protein
MAMSIYVGMIMNITESVGSTTAIDASDHHISIQYSDTGTHVATLPAISASIHGQVYHIKDADYNCSVNNITVDTTGADVIDEETDQTMTIDGTCLTVIANNTTKNWEIQ